MSKSIGTPQPDCAARRDAARDRAEARIELADRRGISETEPNGEEVAFDLTYALNYHKGLPHDVNGKVHKASYEAMVRHVTGQEYGSIETLPVGANRSGTGPVSEVNPPRYAVAPTEDAADSGTALGYRKLVSPFTGHVFDTEGSDAGALCIPPAPVVASDELAAEMAEVYLMALLRDTHFTDIAALDTGGGHAEATALADMPWFDGSFNPTNGDRRRFETRGIVASGADLFRGSTPGSKAGPLVSQFMLMGNDSSGRAIEFVPDIVDPPESNFPGRRAQFGRSDGFVLFGTQIIDQRSIVARQGIDYLTNWAAWLDAQNGAAFGGLDVMRGRRRFISTPRDLATYVHFDALYQAYLVACLLMLEDGAAFPADQGLPESSSRTRAAFASFGGPQILSLVTEVATRALKAVWRQKWMHHRRTRPEVVAGLLTLHASQPGLIPNPDLAAALGMLQGKIPAPILAAIQARNAANPTPIVPKAAIDATLGALPVIPDATNFLLPMAFPEGSPTHPAYGAGHATVAGACVTVLKAFFEMFETNGEERAWPYADVFQANANGTELETVPGTTLTVQGELDKLAGNISIGRNMAGVHYYTDYYESLRLGERIAVSVLEETLSMYGEPVSMSFTSFDRQHVRIAANGERATVRVFDGDGQVPLDEFFAYHAA